MPSRLKNVCVELNTLSQRFSKIIAGHERPLAALGGGGRRTHRADQRGAAVNAAMGDVFKIVGCSAATEPGGFDGRKYHPVTALCAGGSMKLGRPDGRTSLRYMELTRFGVAAQGRGISRTGGLCWRSSGSCTNAPASLARRSLVPFYDWGALGCGWELGMCPLASAAILSRSNARSSPWDWTR
jgi:hypothetical protein